MKGAVTGGLACSGQNAVTLRARFPTGDCDAVEGVRAEVARRARSPLPHVFDIQQGVAIRPLLAESADFQHPVRSVGTKGGSAGASIFRV